jgi:membrane fusion protein (multidrug efflux system)
VLQIPRAVGNQWLVASGLKPGDQVIVDNLQRVRPGAPVKAVLAAANVTASNAN